MVEERRRRKMEDFALSEAAAIDIIDLTAESPVRRVLSNRRNVVLENQPNRFRRPVGRPRRRSARLGTQSADTTISIEDTNNVDENENSNQNTENVVEVPEEVIDLDQYQHQHQRDNADVVPAINDSFTGTRTLLSCPICFENLSESRKPMSTPCGHLFCRTCLKMCLTKIRQCPVCKKKISMTSCHRIYF